MFERYTEHARRVIFFARYEAGQLGDQQIDSQHLLLGLMREDAALLLNCVAKEEFEKIRNAIEEEARARNPKFDVPTSVDLPLSSDGKRILAYAAEEAERAGNKHIGTEHLLLGMLRENKTFAAQLLEKRGITLEAFRERFRSGYYYSREKQFEGTPLENRRTADGCIEFVDTETGERVGIMGMHWNYPLPRATDFILLANVHGEQARYEVLEVVFDYIRQLASQPYSIQHLKNITVKVRRAEQRPPAFAEST